MVYPSPVYSKQNCFRLTALCLFLSSTGLFTTAPTYILKSLIPYVCNSVCIGVGRFRIFGGQDLEWGGGGKGGQIPSRHTTSYWRRCDATTWHRRHVPTRLFINQCQIITFLILKSDNIENARIELKGIVWPAPSNQIKVTLFIILPFNLVHLWFFPVALRNWRKVWVDYCVCVCGVGGGGGAMGMLGPLSNYWGHAPLPPPLFLRLRYICNSVGYQMLLMMITDPNP